MPCLTLASWCCSLVRSSLDHCICVPVVHHGHALWQCCSLSVQTLSLPDKYSSFEECTIHVTVNFYHLKFIFIYRLLLSPGFFDKFFSTSSQWFQATCSSLATWAVLHWLVTSTQQFQVTCSLVTTWTVFHRLIDLLHRHSNAGQHVRLWQNELYFINWLHRHSNAGWCVYSW